MDFNPFSAYGVYGNLNNPMDSQVRFPQNGVFVFPTFNFIESNLSHPFSTKKQYTSESNSPYSGYDFGHGNFLENADETFTKINSGKRHPKSKFSDDEDIKLLELVEKYGENWSQIASEMDGRNVRQCRERWRNYLSPDVANRPWTEEEDKLLDEKYAQFGPKWKHIASFFAKRTDINIKSRWQVHLRKIRKERKEEAQSLKKRLYAQQNIAYNNSHRAFHSLNTNQAPFIPFSSAPVSNQTLEAPSFAPLPPIFPKEQNNKGKKVNVNQEHVFGLTDDYGEALNEFMDCSWFENDSLPFADLGSFDNI